jgi:uncharacterized protein (TIGR02231 family)
MLKTFLLVLLTAQIAFSQSTQTLKTTVKTATVFTQGAQLFSKQTVTLGAGVTNLIFENVSPNLMEKSLQASAGGGLVIMDVRYNLQFAEVEKKPDDPTQKKLRRDLKLVEDSLVEHGFLLKDIQNRKNDLTTERTVVVGNRLMRGELQRDSLALFIKSVDFLRTRLRELDADLLKIEREQYRAGLVQNQLAERKATLQKILSGNYPADGTQPEPVPQVIVTVQTEKALTTEIALNYFVQQAGWTASYDLRANRTSTDIELNHLAKVWQQSGIEWKNVVLTLSTGDPNQSNVKPVLSPVLLSFQPAFALYDSKEKTALAKRAAPLQNQNYILSAPATEAASGQVKDDVGVEDYTTVSKNMLRVEYEISLPYTIQSDNQQHNVTIQNRKVSAMYQYSVVPKLDPDAFLMARVTGWEDLNLIEGPARVYFDGSYVGESYINPNTVNDTMLLNLGRDKSIVVKRQRLKDKSREKILTEDRVLTQDFEITVRNTKNMPIRIVVEDQIPVSKEGNIKVDKLDYGKARYNVDTGKLTWDFKLDSKDNKRLEFSYEIRYPRDRQVYNL